MPTLDETQARMMHALRHGDFDGRAAALLRSRTGISPERRLQVYRNNSVQSLGAALAAVYPVIVRLVGEPFFQRVARAYLDAHPSRSGHLQPFGAELPAFIEAPPSAAGLPYLADVARLEWAWHEAWHAADRVPLEADAFAAFPVEAQASLRFALQPAARIVVSPWPVLAIWRGNQDDADSGAPAIALDEVGDSVLVVRRGFEVGLHRLDDAEAAWLQALAAARPLGEAVAEALVQDPGFYLGGALLRQLALGTFCGLSIAGTTP